MILDLLTYLLASSPLTGLIGTRLYPVRFPQNVTYPAIQYQKIDTIPVQSHQGASALRVSRWQFTIIAQRYSDAQLVLTAFKNRAEYYNRNKATLGGMLGNTQVDSISVVEGSTADDPVLGYYSEVVDLLIGYRENAV